MAFFLLSCILLPFIPTPAAFHFNGILNVFLPPDTIENTPRAGPGPADEIRASQKVEEKHNRGWKGEENG